MSKLPVVDMQGASVGDVEVADGLLVLDKGEQAVHQVVVAMMNARRAGTACAKSKGEVAGSGAKPWRQKGTGRARAGYKQSPVWRGGAVAFGPRPRSYAQKVNRKVVQLAFRRALSDKINDGELRVVESITVEEPRTRLFAALLKNLGVGSRVLVVVDQLERNTALAARNFPGAQLVAACDVNVYQLLRYPEVVVSKAALLVLTARLEGKREVTA